MFDDALAKPRVAPRDDDKPIGDVELGATTYGGDDSPDSEDNCKQPHQDARGGDEGEGSLGEYFQVLGNHAGSSARRYFRNLGWSVGTINALF